MNAESIRAAIEHEYSCRRGRMGWRFLSSPVETLSSARIAFIGLNPGGSGVDDAHGVFAMPKGKSAYRDEAWAGHSPAGAPLQKQVLALFDLLGEPPDHVLAGNLVPFRSPSWSTLEGADDAVRFGCALWTRILAEATPSIIVTMGAVVATQIMRTLSVVERERIPLEWGRQQARLCSTGSVTMLALPHLSRFGIFGRTEGRVEAALKSALNQPRD